MAENISGKKNFIFFKSDLRGVVIYSPDYITLSFKKETKATQDKLNRLVEKSIRRFLYPLLLKFKILPVQYNQGFSQSHNSFLVRIRLFAQVNFLGGLSR